MSDLRLIKAQITRLRESVERLECWLGHDALLLEECKFAEQTIHGLRTMIIDKQAK